MVFQVSAISESPRALEQTEGILRALLVPTGSLVRAFKDKFTKADWNLVLSKMPNSFHRKKKDRFETFLGGHVAAKLLVLSDEERSKAAKTIQECREGLRKLFVDKTVTVRIVPSALRAGEPMHLQFMRGSDSITLLDVLALAEASFQDTISPREAVQPSAANLSDSEPETALHSLNGPEALEMVAPGTSFGRIAAMAGTREGREADKQIVNVVKEAIGAAGLGVLFAACHKQVSDEQMKRIEDALYYSLSTRGAAKLAHEGSSAYAEPARSSICKLSQKLEEVCNVGPGDTILDLGCGSGFVLHLMAQYLQCRALGVECSKNRFSMAANGVVELLQQLGGHPLFNPNVCLVLEDILHLERLPRCKVLYLYDEAFDDDLMEHILRLVNGADETLEFVLSAKVLKHRRYYRDFWEEAGLEQCSEPIQGAMIGSSARSTWIMYKRVSATRDHTCSDLDVTAGSVSDLDARAQTFFNAPTESKIEYYCQHLPNGPVMTRGMRRDAGDEL